MVEWWIFSICLCIMRHMTELKRGTITIHQSDEEKKAQTGSMRTLLVGPRGEVLVIQFDNPVEPGAIMEGLSFPRSTPLIINIRQPTTHPFLMQTQEPGLSVDCPYRVSTGDNQVTLSPLPPLL